MPRIPAIALLALTALASQSLASLSAQAVRAEVEQAERAAEEDEIETDRDSFTPASTLAGKGRVIVESAYSFIDNRRVGETHSLPELLVRYGIAERVELRWGTNYEVGGAGNPVSANVPDDDLEEGASIDEEANFSYGLKLALTEQEPWIGRSAMLLQGFTPLSGKETDTHVVATYVNQQTFANGWMWDWALRYSTGSNEADHFNVWAPSTVLKVPVGERWKAHLEYFGVFSDGRARESTQHFVSPGIHCLITPDWELGVRVGWGLNDQSPHFFANVGGGYRF